MTTGIIYGTQSGIVRRVVTVSGSDFSGHLGNGESVYVYTGSSRSLPDIVEESKVAITGIIGKPIEDDKVAVVHGDGSIRNFIKADPIIDSVADHTLVTIYDNKISADCTYDVNTGLFHEPERKIPAGTQIRDKVTGNTTILAVDQILNTAGPIARK